MTKIFIQLEEIAIQYVIVIKQMLYSNLIYYPK